MDPREAAEYLSLDEKTITRWARKGYIPAHPLGEGKRKFWRFMEHELLEWLNAQTNGAIPDNSANKAESRSRINRFKEEW